MKINWNYPTSVWLGENRIKDLSQACKILKISNPLFVTDKDLVRLPMVKNVIFDVKNNFNELCIFSNFSGNPIGENVDEGVLVYKKNNCDGVIAFGGGGGMHATSLAKELNIPKVIVPVNSSVFLHGVCL